MTHASHTVGLNQINSPRSSRLPLLGISLGLAAMGAALIAGTGCRQGWWHFLRGIQIAEGAVYVAAIGFVLSLLGLWRLRRQPGAVMTGLLGVLLTLPLLAIGLQWEYATRTYPPINDISTDTENPPEFWDMPNPMAYPGAVVAQQQRLGYPDLLPLTLDMAPPVVFGKALHLVQERGWTVVGSDANEGRIEAVATSRLFGFSDEVTIRIATEGSGSRVDIRSRSRLGQIDRGTNAQRIRGWMDDLQVRTQQKP